MLKKLSLVFAAGCFGAVANSFAAWGFGALGITTAVGVAITPPLTAAWFYPRIVWGGIWGAQFLVPLRESVITRGLIWSLAPTAVQLFVVFPYKTGNGMLGLDLGTLTPFFVLFFNAVWGIATAFFLKAAGDK